MKRDDVSETPEGRRERAELDDLCLQIAEALSDVLPPGVGFAVQLFQFDPGRQFAWITNAKREDMLKALDELRVRLPAGMADEHKVAAWQSDDRACSRCEGHVQYRNRESSDGGHVDTQYRCTQCGRTWWAEGSDA